MAFTFIYRTRFGTFAERAIDPIRPFDAGRPICREPPHRSRNGQDTDIGARPDTTKTLAISQHTRRKRGLGLAGGGAPSVGGSQQVGDRITHTPTLRDISRYCQRDLSRWSA